MKISLILIALLLYIDVIAADSLPFCELPNGMYVNPFLMASMGVKLDSTLSSDIANFETRRYFYKNNKLDSTYIQRDFLQTIPPYTLKWEYKVIWSSDTSFFDGSSNCLYKKETNQYTCTNSDGFFVFNNFNKDSLFVYSYNSPSYQKIDSMWLINDTAFYIHNSKNVLDQYPERYAYTNKLINNVCIDNPIITNTKFEKKYENEIIILQSYSGSTYRYYYFSELDILPVQNIKSPKITFKQNSLIKYNLLGQRKN